MDQNPQPSLKEVYISQALYPQDIDRTLVMHCSDPYYREATAEYLGKSLRLFQYDLMANPGGPTVVLQSSLTFTTDRARMKLLTEHHHLTRFVGISHLNCAYYKLRYPSLSDEERRKKQLEDLNGFERIVRSFVPQAEIKLCFVEQVANIFRFQEVR